MLSPETRKRIQMLLALLLAAAAIRLAIILYQRHQESQPLPPPAVKLLDPDYYVLPKKLYAYDLESARRGLVDHTVWVREGYRSICYPFDAARHRSDFHHEAGLLGPLQPLAVVDVVRDASPAPGQQQVMVVFRRDGKDFAFPVGAVKGQDYQLYIDDMLYLEDPHQLYRHWGPETWQAVDQHQARLGMNELQVGFAIGVGYLQGSGLGSERTLTYPNGGHPLVITFDDGKAVSIEPEKKP